jgi:hypothetical protein
MEASKSSPLINENFSREKGVIWVGCVFFGERKKEEKECVINSYV